MKSGEEKKAIEIEGDLYKVLGVSPASDLDVIKKAFKRQALELHPDRNFGKSEEVLRQQQAQFIKIKEAYDVLSDPIQRAGHDAYLRAEFANKVAESNLDRTHIVDPYPPRDSCILIWSPPDFRIRYFDNIGEGLDIIRSMAETGRLNSNFKLVDGMDEVTRLTAEGADNALKTGGRRGTPQIMIEIAMTKEQASEMFKGIQTAKTSGNLDTENGLKEKLNLNIHGARIVVPYGDRSAETRYHDFVEEDKQGQRIAVFSRPDLQNEDVLSVNQKASLQDLRKKSPSAQGTKEIKGSENVFGKLAGWVRDRIGGTPLKEEPQSLAIEGSESVKKAETKPVLQIEAGSASPSKPAPQSVQEALKDSQQISQFKEIKNAVKLALDNPNDAAIIKNLDQFKDQSKLVHKAYVSIAVEDMGRLKEGNLDTKTKGRLERRVGDIEKIHNSAFNEAKKLVSRDEVQSPQIRSVGKQ